MFTLPLFVERDNSFDTETLCGLGAPGFKDPFVAEAGDIFLIQSVWTNCGTHRTSCLMTSTPFPRDVKLTVHIHLAFSLRMCGAITLISPYAVLYLLD
jgi:hypothetical protein